MYVVLGAADVPSLEGCIKVHNGEWATGVASSLRAGLAALSPETSAVVVLLVDQPGNTPEAVRRVISAHDQDATVAVATYRGERGHPILFDRAHFRAISQSATGDSGARAFLREHPELVTAVPCDDIADPGRH